jgi:integrase
MAACDPWTEAEMVSLLESKALGHGDRVRNRALFALQCATGARISELLTLRRRDVLTGAGVLAKRVALTNTKNGRTRVVDVVNAFVGPFLLAWLERQQALGYARADQALFSSATGRGLTRWAWYRLVTRACRECRLPGRYGTHSARKTWARDTYRWYHARAMAGELVDPLLKLQEAGGWVTIDAARRYISFMLGDTSASQAALYPTLQTLYSEGAEKTQNAKGHKITKR